MFVTSMYGHWANVAAILVFIKKIKLKYHINNRPVCEFTGNNPPSVSSHVISSLQVFSVLRLAGV